MTQKLPGAGGSYTRDPDTGALTKTEATETGRDAPAPKKKPTRATGGKTKEA